MDDHDGSASDRSVPLVRPFLGGSSAGPPAQPPPRPDPLRPTTSAVRPYLLTGGRARPDTGLEIEAQVLTTTVGEDALDRYRYEQREILLLCRAPLAVAEVAARLGLHLGVARVLVGDLIACGHLASRRPDSGLHRNAAIIERVIRGLQAIH
ncbi:DUF742 domain-containing protein [Dactylosporangium sucinum]|uniref:DUF742 domain-containing protein n=1 Tax=Dactylosporangium sucinum TaxID=1424081 RepID=A0A917TVD9_9ACTN|nr:DUF742 domain-containing protein [Dactylosporangium sucinum]GGM37636.1 hypothetical protein GCM10007977_043900 [Dactylosporangium sucinum]